MPTRHTNDLFELFPDLPWTRVRTAAEQIRAVRKRVSETRQRATGNIERQRQNTERVRAAISARRRR